MTHSNRYFENYLWAKEWHHWWLGGLGLLLNDCEYLEFYSQATVWKNIFCLVRYSRNSFHSQGIGCVNNKKENPLRKLFSVYTSKPRDTDEPDKCHMDCFKSCNVNIIKWNNVSMGQLNFLKRHTASYWILNYKEIAELLAWCALISSQRLWICISEVLMNSVLR